MMGMFIGAVIGILMSLIVEQFRLRKKYNEIIKTMDYIYLFEMSKMEAKLVDFEMRLRDLDRYQKLHTSRSFLKGALLWQTAA